MRLPKRAAPSLNTHCCHGNNIGHKLIQKGQEVVRRLLTCIVACIAVASLRPTPMPERTDWIDMMPRR